MKQILVLGVATAALLFGTTTPAYAQQEQHEKEAKPGQQQRAPQGQQQAKPEHQHQQRAEQPQARPEQQRQQHAQQQQQEARPEQQQQQRVRQQQRQGWPQQPQQQRAQQQQPQVQQQQQPVQQQQRQVWQQAQQQRAQQQQPQGGYTVPQRSQQVSRGWQQQRGWLQQGGGWQGNSSWQQDRAQNWQVDHRTWAQRGGYGGYYIPSDRFVLYFGRQHWFRIHSRPIIVAGYPRFQYGGYSFMMLDPWPEGWSEDWYATDDVYVGYDNGYYLYNRRDPSFGIALTVVL